jgi:hypothetical protein
MARKKAAQEAAMKKAAKQKKILIVLALPMVAALYFMVTTFMSLGKHSSPDSAAPPAATAPAGSGSATGTPIAATLAPVVPGVAAVPIVAFRSFTALGQKNPFHDHGPNAGASNSTGKTKSSKAKNPKIGPKTKGPSAPLTGAVISLNGDKLALAIGTKFGQAPGLSGVPLFKLLKATAKTALVAVVGTKQEFTLHVKQPLTLQQYGGWTYTLILEPLGSPAPMTVKPTTKSPPTKHPTKHPGK